MSGEDVLMWLERLRGRRQGNKNNRTLELLLNAILIIHVWQEFERKKNVHHHNVHQTQFLKHICQLNENQTLGIIRITRLISNGRVHDV